MDGMWEKIRKSLKDGAALSIEKIEEYAKIGKLKVEELAAKRKIERNFLDIGERVFDLIEEGNGKTVADDLVIKKASENITALKEEIAEIQKKIDEVSEEARKKHGDVNEDDEVNSV
jgi:hypothetical protein